MSILVTGGTGFIGRRLVKKLLKSDKPNDVVIFARKGDEELEKSGAKFVLGNIRSKDDFERAFSEFTDIDSDIKVVYHLAANLDESDPEMYDDNVEGTRNVVDTCKNYNVKRIIFMGSCGVLGDVKTAREDMPYNPKTRYEESKAESERIIINSGLAYTIIRAPVIIGPNEIWLKIIEAARKKYPVIGSGKNHFHLAYVDDVVDLLGLVKDEKKAENQIFHIATPDARTYKDVYGMICKELGIEMTKRHVPVFLIKLASALHLISCKIKGKKPTLTLMKSSIDRLIRDRVISTEKARDILGFEPKYNTEMAVKATVKSLKERNAL